MRPAIPGLTSATYKLMEPHLCATAFQNRQLFDMPKFLQIYLRTLFSVPRNIVPSSSCGCFQVHLHRSWIDETQKKLIKKTFGSDCSYVLVWILLTDKNIFIRISYEGILYQVLLRCYGAVAQPVEHPSKVPVWCNFTDGSNPGRSSRR